MIDDATYAAICKHAHQIASRAPPLTAKQSYLLNTLFTRYPTSVGEPSSPPTSARLHNDHAADRIALAHP